MKHASEGIHLDFESEGRCYEMSKTGVSMDPQKELMSSIAFFPDINLLLHLFRIALQSQNNGNCLYIIYTKCDKGGTLSIYD